MTEQNFTGVPAELKSIDGQNYTYGENISSAWPRYKPVQPAPKPIQGTLVQEIKSVRRVYRGKGRKMDTNSTILSCSTDEQAVREFMADYGVTPELIDCTVAKWSELVSTMPARGNGRLYKWTRTENRGTVKPMSRRKLDEVTFTKNVPVQWTFELRSILALIGALVQCMPEPVQVIRNKTIHGEDGKKSTVPMVYFDFEDDSVEAYTRFVVAVVTPYAVRKISGYEREMTGQVYERTLHRTTDMGQGGRRFSDSDISDILSRTILASFFPLYCRTLPLTDRGKAYVMVKSCKLISRTVGVKACKIRVAVPALQSLDRKIKDCTKLYMKGKITEREFIDAKADMLSKFTLPKPHKRSSVRTVTVNGFWVCFECNQTGQRFSVFTKSAQKAEQWSTLTSFCGEVDRVIPVDQSEITELKDNTVYRWQPERAFHRSLKSMTRNLYRFLMRRCEHDDPLITEHDQSRRLRKNSEYLFSLYEVMQNETLTPVQRDVLSAELSLDEVPRHVGVNDKKTWLYNSIAEKRTGVNPKIGRRAYIELRNVTFHCIEVQLGLVEQPKREVVQEYTEEELDSLVCRIPLWIKERADRVQLTSFETAFAVQSGIDRSTVYKTPEGPTVFPEVYKRLMAGGRGHFEPVQLTPVQYPVLSRPMARHVAAVRAITGLVDVENPKCKGVHLDTMTVNGYKVPVWTTEQEAWVSFRPELNIRTTLYESLPENVYGPPSCCGSIAVVDKDTPVEPVMVRGTVQSYYIDVLTADGDGI